MRSRIVWFVLLATLFAAPLSAGVVAQMENRDLSGDAETKTQVRILLQDKLARFDDGMTESSGPDTSMIFRGDREEMLVVEHGRKQVMRIDQQTIEQLGAQMNAMMKQMEEQMANMPPEVRQMMKDKMPGMGAAPAVPKIEVKATTVRETQQGYPCLRYDVFQEGKRVREYWVTSMDNVGITSEDFSVFQEMSGFFEKMLNAFSQAMSLQEMLENPVAELAKMDGFPVLMREYDGDKVVQENRLVSVEKRSLPAEEFDAPAGYKETKMGM